MEDNSHTVTRTVKRYTVYRGSSPSSAQRLEIRLRELEENLDTEREARLRAERHSNELQMMLDDANSRLDDFDGVSTQQVEISKRREAEVNKLRKEIEVLNLQMETSESSTKKRYQEAMRGLQDQIDSLTKARNRADKEKQSLLVEIEGLTGQYEGSCTTISSLQAKLDGLDATVKSLKGQLEDASKQLGEASAARSRLTQENFELQRQLQELDSNNGLLLSQKTQLQKAADEARRAADDAERQRAALQAQLSALQVDLSGANARLEDEQNANSELRASLSRVNAELAAFRAKYEREVVAVMEQLEETKRKYTARIAELEDDLNNALMRAGKAEKERNKLASELREIHIIVENLEEEKATLLSDLRDVERERDDFAVQARDLADQLAQARADNQRLADANANLTNQNKNLADRLGEAQRENASLSAQLKEARDALRDAQTQLADLQALRAQLEADRDALAVALKDAEDGLRAAEARYQKAAADLAHLKLEMENRLKAKEEELDNLRRNSQRTIEELQQTIIDMELRHKSDLGRLKKKYELEIHDLVTRLDLANHARAEAEKSAKALSQRLKELESLMEEEHRRAEEAISSLSISERKRVALQTEIEDVRTLLEQTERARKAADGELSEANARISELTIVVQGLTNDKRRMETDVAAMQSDLDEALNGRRLAEEALTRANNENARLAEELRGALESGRRSETLRKQAETEVRELMIRVEEAEAFGQKEAKRMIASLQGRVRDLEVELAEEQRRHREAAVSARKFERLLKESQVQIEDDRRVIAMLQDNVDQLTVKFRTAKKHIEEVEDVNSITLNKFRKAQAAASEAESRAELAERSAPAVRASPGPRTFKVTRETYRVVKR